MDELLQIVRLASARPQVCRAAHELYAAVALEVEARRPRCDLSGRCCRFEAYGHRLYVTTIELACFVNDLPRQRRNDPTVEPPPWDGLGCPFQQGRLCGVHAIRPFGCRIFFCDPASTDWQNDAYERFHTNLRRLHDDLAVPYRYLEWRAALHALGLASAATPAP